MSFYVTQAAVSMIADLETGAGLVRIARGEGAQVMPMQWSEDGADTADSGEPATASYSGLDLGGKPHFAMMTFSLTPGAADSGSAVLIANPNGLSQIAQITQGSLHLAFADGKVDVGVYTAGILTVTTLPYLRVLAKDGSKYRAGFALAPSRIVVFLPDGQAVTVGSSAYYNAAGRFVQFESFSMAPVATRARFHSVTMERAV